MKAVELTKIEEIQVKKILDSGTTYKSIYKLIRDWEDFVEDIKKGYELNIDDYTGDLQIRNIIESILRGVPSLYQRLYEIISPMDDEFINATVEIEQPIFRNEPGYWYKRIPKIINDELRNDIVNWEIKIISK